MSKPYDMELFLAGVLTGAHATRKRHIRQAKAIQAAISSRWHLNNPWTWQRKHLAWFVNHHMRLHSKATRYYYCLTLNLITLRVGKSWNVLGWPSANLQPVAAAKEMKMIVPEPQSRATSSQVHAVTSPKRAISELAKSGCHSI